MAGDLAGFGENGCSARVISRNYFKAPLQPGTNHFVKEHIWIRS